MNILRFFRRDMLERQLGELYRSAEEGSRAPEVDLTSRRAFEADQKLISQLRRLATLAEPRDLSVERGNLLARVALKKGGEVEDQVPIIRKTLQKRTIAMAGAAMILLGAAATVGAAGGVSDVAGTVEDVLEALNITERTADEADGRIDEIAQPEGSGLQPVDAPPVDLPPVAAPPVDLPPVAAPPVDLPPVAAPPVDLPPVDVTPGPPSP